MRTIFDRRCCRLLAVKLRIEIHGMPCGLGFVWPVVALALRLHLPSVSSGAKGDRQSGRRRVGDSTAAWLLRMSGVMPTAFSSSTGSACRVTAVHGGMQSSFDDPIARKLAGVNDGGCVGVEGSGTVSADLHDGVNATSFHARGLGRCE